jgi:hypothetical protein
VDRTKFFPDGRFTPEYQSWILARRRCINRRSADYADYGGRGIRMCQKWLGSFADFLADMGPRPPGTTLDRKETNGDYCPENCRWATSIEQSQNRRCVKKYTHAGRTFCLAEWSRVLGVPLATLCSRLEAGRPLAEVLTTRRFNGKVNTPRQRQQKRKARQCVNNAVNRGKLRRPTRCGACGSACRPQAHHHRGYARRFWLDVAWLCAGCHAPMKVA